MADQKKIPVKKNQAPKIDRIKLQNAVNDINAVLDLDPQIDAEQDDKQLVEILQYCGTDPRMISPHDKLNDETWEVLEQLNASPRVKKAAPVKRKAAKPKAPKKDAKPRFTRFHATALALDSMVDDDGAVDIKALVTEAAKVHAEHAGTNVNEKEAKWATTQVLSTLEACGLAKRADGKIVLADCLSTTLTEAVEAINEAHPA